LGLTCCKFLFKTSLSAFKIVGVSYIALEFLDSFGIIGAEEGYKFAPEGMYRTGAPPPLANEYEGVLRHACNVADGLRATMHKYFHPLVQVGVKNFVDREPYLSKGLVVGSVLGILLL
jgi:hypothetical protein